MSEANRNEIFTGTRDVTSAGTNTVIPAHMVQSLDFEIPVESVPLPSLGRIYPQGHPLHNRETVDIRSMTAREEDILTSQALIKKGTVLTELIRSCLMDKTINVDDMVSGDRTSLMVAIRITGYGTEYKGTITCPTCDTAGEHVFNLGELGIKRLGISPITDGANLFEFRLPVTKKNVRFKFLTGRDEIDISTIIDKSRKSGAVGSNLVTTRLQYFVIDIDGNSDRARINQFIRNMPARDSLSLRRFIDDNEPGLDMTINVDCESCSASISTAMPIGPSFFWPDA